MPSAHARVVTVHARLLVSVPSYIDCHTGLLLAAKAERRMHICYIACHVQLTLERIVAGLWIGIEDRLRASRLVSDDAGHSCPLRFC